ncbi:MAG: ParB N-terminal domain-containing protein [Clostridiales bacterium]|nr:ParB N-terminal domain-containing protein [Clostridiales bacterium]
MKMDKLNIRTMKLADLNPAKYNPRKELKPGDSEFEKLKNSIKNFGYVELIVVNEANDNTVISGHQRLSVLKHLGETEAECVIVNMNEADEKALNIAMNKVSSEWDTVKLADLLDDLKSLDYDLQFTGFDAAEIDDLFSNVHNKDIKEDNFDVEEELKRPAFSKLGDIWHIGKHRVICGDSTLPETYEKLLDGIKVNLVCTDPPYFVNLESTSGKIRNDDLDDKSALEFLMKVFKCFHDFMAEDASIYVFYATAKTRIFFDAFEDCGFKVGVGLVWKKDRLVLTRTDWKYLHEPLIFGWRKDGRHRWYGDQKQTTVFEFPRLKSSKEEGFGHPSNKPVPLLAYLIRQSSMTNGVVLDGFLGSASTLIACEQLDRVCCGVEIEEKYVDCAVKRYIQFKEGNSSDVYVIRDGQKLTLDEVLQLTEEGGTDDVINN